MIKIIKGLWKIYKDYRKRKAELVELMKVGRVLIKLGVLQNIWLPTIGKYTIDVETIDEMLEAREKLKALPIKEQWVLSSWSPYGDRIMFQWLYPKNKVAIWLACTVDTIPPGLLKPGCSYVKQEEEPSYALVCKKENT